MKQASERDQRRLKHAMRAFYFFSIVPCILIFTGLVFLPSKIPLHMGLGGAINRWGTKFELLIYLPIFFIFYFFVRKIVALNEVKAVDDDRVASWILVALFTVSIVMFNVILILHLWVAGLFSFLQ